MIQIKVRPFFHLKDLMGSGEMALQLGGRATVGDALEELCQRIGEPFRDALMDPQTGKVRSYYRVLEFCQSDAAWGCKLPQNGGFLQIDKLEPLENKGLGDSPQWSRIPNAPEEMTDKRTTFRLTCQIIPCRV